MAKTSKRRKIETYRLTISGLKKDVEYIDLLNSAWMAIHQGDEGVQTIGDVSHVLYEARIEQQTLWLRFLSFTEGERPDIIDTESLKLKTNPLADSEAQVYWTHAILGERNGRMLLILERVQQGIWPTRIEGYLQWMLDHQANSKLRLQATENLLEPITVSIELETEDSFMEQVRRMDRIHSASLRIVRPNPGWKDYEDLLSKEAQASDAHHADISMNARRNSSLSKSDGIIQAMDELQKRKKLGRAAVDGILDGQNKRITTEKHGKFRYESLPVDADGIVKHDEALVRFVEYYEKAD